MTDPISRRRFFQALAASALAVAAPLPIGFPRGNVWTWEMPGAGAYTASEVLALREAMQRELSKAFALRMDVFMVEVIRGSPVGSATLLLTSHHHQRI